MQEKSIPLPPRDWSVHLRLAHASFLLLLCALAGNGLQAQRARCPVQGGEPMILEGNAPIVTLNLRRTNGTFRPVRLLFDSGGGALILNEPVAQALGLHRTGAAVRDSGTTFYAAPSVQASFGSLPVSLATSRTFIHAGKTSFDTREDVDGLLPGKALEPYDVVLDYPQSRFTIAPAGCLPHRGFRIASPYRPENGHLQVDARVDGQTMRFLIDTGSRVTLARRDLLERLLAAHPAWPHAEGASGAADMPQGSGRELLVRVPELTWGAFRLVDVLVASRPDETYGTTFFETPSPIVGALGGNVLKHFRVEIDYPEGATYLEQSGIECGGDMDSAGLVLDVRADARAGNQLIVVALTSTAAGFNRKRVLPGDRILQIDGRRPQTWSIVEASNALSGAPGHLRHLTIRRAHTVIHTEVEVTDLLPSLQSQPVTGKALLKE
jgi:hypothetical protein